MGNQAKRSFVGLIEQLGDAKAGALLHALVIILLRNTAAAGDGKLADDPAVGKRIIDYDRVAIAGSLADPAKPSPQ